MKDEFLESKVASDVHNPISCAFRVFKWKKRKKEKKKRKKKASLSFFKVSFLHNLIFVYLL